MFYQLSCGKWRSLCACFSVRHTFPLFSSLATLFLSWATSRQGRRKGHEIQGLFCFENDWMDKPEGRCKRPKQRVLCGVLLRCPVRPGRQFCKLKCEVKNVSFHTCLPHPSLWTVDPGNSLEDFNRGRCAEKRLGLSERSRWHHAGLPSLPLKAYGGHSPGGQGGGCCLPWSPPWLLGDRTVL